jgi:hypothetical protein
VKATHRQDIKPLGSFRIRAISPILTLAVIFSLAVSSGTLHAAQVPAKQLLSPEILAMHARAKRPAATAPTTSLELAATTSASTSTSFNSEQGPVLAQLVPARGAICSQRPRP